MRQLVRAAFGAALLVAGCSSSNSNEPPRRVSITVAAASDLRLAFEALGERFRETTGADVTFTFGSSGQLKEQILNGAPFDVFASANVAFVDEVITEGFGDPNTKRTYGFGRLAIVVPGGAAPPAEVATLASPQFRRIAIANPAHAPYGVAAQQALDSAGVAEEVADRLVLAENVSDALRIVRSGNADAGIVALSLVITGDGPYALVDAVAHAPLEQALVLTTKRTEALGPARAFADLVTRPDGRMVMVRHGFVLPGESLPVATPTTTR